MNIQIKVTVNGFYYTEDGSEIVKVGLLVENTFDKAIKLSLSCNSINGIATSNDYIYMYDSFKKKALPRYMRICTILQTAS